ncbi:FAD-dependent oxidoreductase [Henriciella aquimarina]|uniref:FAD-dependent oxidoreductase n=1 Tax=Henriciella aquimarina TaxID=545261 RepID=UPI000A067C6C|nr:FAD-dependent oxidoreductase [Henriciella aquimarina]
MTKPPANVNYTFSDAELEQLMAYGRVRHHLPGDPLIAEGDAKADCLVTLSGFTNILVETAEGEKRVGWMERGQFAGDITVLTGQASLSRVEMGEEGDVLHIRHDAFQRLLVENSALSDIFVRTLTARRAFAHEAQHGSVIVIGDAHDRNVFAARDLLAKHMVPHRWLDPIKDPLAWPILKAREITEDDLPVVIRGRSRLLSRPSIAELSEAFGLDLLPDGSTADVIVVGAGPAGLAASVYAASEGLSVLTLDSEGPGGQAGTSSKIENYLGFPMGVSGRELAARAAIQAQKFGARIAAPAKATGLDRDGEGYCITLQDGRRLRSRAVVIATGAQYRRLPIPGLERYEGRGIYYGATAMEAQLCTGQEVSIVGAGNSAGQGAVFLSQTAKAVHVLYRRADIRQTMSEYLVRRLEETPNIHLHPSSEIAALHGIDGASPSEDRLVEMTFLNNQTEESGQLKTPFVFLFIGAAPFTDWLPPHMSCDEKGFVKTGTDLANIDLVRASWLLERMPTRYETSWPRVYAVGDVRIGSVKRVASSVGEGSVVVSDIHRALAETAEA